MKIRMGFVSNSSSMAFIITNISEEKKNIADFVIENPQILADYNGEYTPDCGDAIADEELLESAKAENLSFNPGESKYCVFGDEQGTVIGRVFDYMLRDSGKSNSFSWMFREALR